MFAGIALPPTTCPRSAAAGGPAPDRPELEHYTLKTSMIAKRRRTHSLKAKPNQLILD